MIAICFTFMASRTKSEAVRVDKFAGESSGLTLRGCVTARTMREDRLFAVPRPLLWLSRAAKFEIWPALDAMTWP